VNFAEIIDKEEAVRQTFGYYIEFGGSDLEYVMLRENPLDLNALGLIISDELLVDYCTETGTLLFSPKSHPNYPCWLPEHRVNQ
jgi:hypothetical protein